MWSDDKLSQFAKNVVSQAAHKESRFAAMSNASMLSTASSESDNLHLEQVERQGLFLLEPKLIVKIIQLLDLPSLTKVRGANKFLQSVLVEKEFCLLWHIDVSPHNKMITDAKLTTLLSIVGPHLQSLSLKNCWPLTNSGLAMIPSFCPKLTSLDLSSVWELTDTGLQSIAEQSNLLTSIDLSNCRKITDVGILSLLDSSTNLQAINVAYCKNLTGKMMNHLTWSNIKEANLQRATGIRDDGFLSWKIPSASSGGITLDSLLFALQDLNLSDCSFLTDNCIQVLGTKCPQLKRLCLSFCCSLTEKFATFLSEGCPFIEILDASYCGGAVNDNAVLTLAQGLPRLTSLGLRGCVQLTDLGLERLATHALSLHTINFTQCKNVSANICQKLGTSSLWTCISTPIYHAESSVKRQTDPRYRKLSSIN